MGESRHIVPYQFRRMKSGATVSANQIPLLDSRKINPLRAISPADPRRDLRIRGKMNVVPRHRLQSLRKDRRQKTLDGAVNSPSGGVAMGHARSTSTECPCLARMRVPSAESSKRCLSLSATVRSRADGSWPSRASDARTASTIAQPEPSSFKPPASGAWRSQYESNFARFRLIGLQTTGSKAAVVAFGRAPGSTIQPAILSGKQQADTHRPLSLTSDVPARSTRPLPGTRTRHSGVRPPHRLRTTGATSRECGV